MNERRPQLTVIKGGPDVASIAEDLQKAADALRRVYKAFNWLLMPRSTVIV